MTNSTLTELGYKYNTDKAFRHKYTYVYDEHFAKLRNNNLNLLEIGLCAGASVKMWEEYFQNGHIYGVDISDKSHFNTQRIKTCIADQGVFDQISNVYPGIEFDIIVDDGGHRMEQQVISLAALFSRLKPGGIYIIEDLQTSTGWYDYEKDVTALKMLYDMKDKGEIEDVYPVKKELLMEVYNQFQSLEIEVLDWKESVMALIYKRT